MEIRKWHVLLMTVLLVAMTVIGCSQGAIDDHKESGQSTGNSILLATTTSTENSGLLDDILPILTEDTGVEVKVVAVGTGQALQMGKDGEVDVILAHSKKAEDEFVQEDHGIQRFDVMYNDFVLIGPKDDPADIGVLAKNDILKALSIFQNTEETFLSRGDDSGTHKMELQLWETLGIDPKGRWYVSAGQGMGAVIQMTNEMLGYTLSDRATYLSMKHNLDLDIILEGDGMLFNQYGVIAVNPNKNVQINYEGAMILIEWLLSEKGQGLIGEFGQSEFGQSLFIPNAK
ncbi:extracellular solute-binding protein, family 1 [Alkaliphilus metalliredigens QYMF]|uniref:Extracellular solute-binding protein, family 1 n=1 Tax=Alkaliphilus metalliredigens (strain QYMF) TaxID=293826 RepID=A6TM21_ALKMQ|nr:substrate-binding domain-containing protein [Alkaliphilus metalliredigens]ABR47239.1 extracellular solute-binding protein, family 1 [Alkaliphilus metalliredigens QYMF]